MDNNIDPNNADRKLVTTKPVTIWATNINKRALIIKVNSPKVSILIGIVKNINKGFMNTLISPITNTANNAGINPERLIPGTTQATKSNAKEKSTHLIRILNRLSIIFSPVY